MNLFVVFEVLGALLKDVFTPTADTIECIQSMAMFFGLFVGTIVVAWVIMYHSPITPFVKKYVELD